MFLRQITYLWYRLFLFFPVYLVCDTFYMNTLWSAVGKIRRETLWIEVTTALKSSLFFCFLKLGKLFHKCSRDSCHHWILLLICCCLCLMRSSYLLSNWSWQLLIFLWKRYCLLQLLTNNLLQSKLVQDCFSSFSVLRFWKDTEHNIFVLTDRGVKYALTLYILVFLKILSKLSNSLLF